jgi:hypothetical protein
VPWRTAGAADGSEDAGFPRVIWIGHLRLSPPELAAVLGGLAVFASLGWDSALWDGRLQLALHLLAAAAIASGAMLVLRGASYPRSGLEAAILVLLVALGVATIQGQNLGLAAHALLASAAYAALLPIAIAVVRRRPEIAALTVVGPSVVIAAAILWQLITRRVGWFALGLPGLPPIRLGGETTAFGSVAVAPFILLGVLPLVLLLDAGWPRRLLLTATIALLAPLAVISGSRSAWLAVGTAGVVFALPAARLLRPGRRWLKVRRVAWLLLALPVLALALAYMAPRFTAITSLLYRERLWRDTLAAWSSSPIFGIGPGTMPYARQAAAAAGVPPVRQPHSHDLALGVLGDAGVVGLAAAVIVVVAFLWVAGPHRSRTIVGRAASSVLVGFLVAGIVEDLTFLPNFNLIVLLLAAIALLDAGAVSWRPLRMPRRLPAMTATGLGAAAAAVILVLGDAAASTFRLGTEAVWAHRWSDAAGWYRVSTDLDPWQPSGPKALAVAADMHGDRSTALAAAREATRLNPGDGTSWTNLAILCAAAGERTCAEEGAAAAARSNGITGQELINAALIEEGLGNDDAADRYYTESLLGNRLTGLTVSWPRRVTLPVSSPLESANPQPQLTRLLASATTGADPPLPSVTEPAARALAFALDGDATAAQAALAAAQRDAASDVVTWEIAAMLERHWGQDASHSARVAEFLKGSPLATRRSALAEVTYDVASLHIFPRDMLVAGAVRLSPVPPWPWILERLLPG